MSVPSLIESFHLHLRARGLRPLTQERYVYGASACIAMPESRRKQ
jgi:hypothetical protein